MDVKECCSILEQVKIKPTSVRILVYMAISEMHDTFSLADLEDRLVSVDKSSLFRALTTFSEHHLLHSMEDGSGSMKYCICHNHGDCTADEWHCHFFCESCKKTFCLEDDSIPKVAVPDGFKVNELNYVIKGICAECNKKNS
jgi:Fur family transcriptional regulator, ferric uptake regulator